MKRAILVFSIIFGVNSIFYAQLLDWNFTGEPGSQVTSNSSTSSTGIGIGVLSRGAGISPNAGTNSMNSSGWVESTNDIDDIAEQIAEDDYYEFTFPILTGYKANITTIVIVLAASGTGPNGSTLRSDQDGYVSDLGSLGSGSGTLTASINQINLTGTITYRLYGTRSTTGGGTTGTLRINDLTINGTSTLPIELISFRGILEENKCNLIWKTAIERDNNYFSIERSTDASRFFEIGQVKGAGDSNEPQEYTFTDTRPQPGKNYYRLRQVDFDGKYTYSKVVSVNFGAASGLTLSPMPASQELRVALDKPSREDGTWQVLDMSGRALRTGSFPAETSDYQLNASDLPEGVYVFRLVMGQEVMVRKFWKG